MKPLIEYYKLPISVEKHSPIIIEKYHLVALRSDGKKIHRRYFGIKTARYVDWGGPLNEDKEKKREKITRQNWWYYNETLGEQREYLEFVERAIDSISEARSRNKIRPWSWK